MGGVAGDESLASSTKQRGLGEAVLLCEKSDQVEAERSFAVVVLSHHKSDLECMDGKVRLGGVLVSLLPVWG